MLEDCKYRELLEENRKLRESVIHLREYDPVTNCTTGKLSVRQPKGLYGRLLRHVLRSSV